MKSEWFGSKKKSVWGLKLSLMVLLLEACCENTKLGGAVDFLEEQEASKKNSDGLEHWAISGMKRK